MIDLVRMKATLDDSTQGMKFATCEIGESARRGRAMARKWSGRAEGDDELMHKIAKVRR